MLKLGRLVQRHPKLVNIFVTLITVGLTIFILELLFGYLNGRNAAVITKNWSGLNRYDSDFGIKMRANDQITDNYVENGKLIYSVKYTTNEFGHRVTPVENKENRHKFLAVFGCSIAFGLCVEDDETIAAEIAKRAPDYVPYNFAYQGYGAQQMLLTLQGPIENEIQEDEGVGLYIFVLAHVYRAIGGMNCVNNWARNFPCYYLDGEELIRNGSFATAHPWRLATLKFLGKSQTLKFFNFTWPYHLTQAHAKLTARIIKESEVVFHQKWPTSPFYVLLYPYQAKQDRSTEVATIIKPFLDEYGIKYIECPDVFEGKIPFEERTVEGGHPSVAANELVAERLVKELGLAEQQAK